MDDREVEQLARHEISSWTSAHDEISSPSAVPSDRDGWHAYAPIGATPIEPAGMDPRFRFIDATAIGATLIVRFSWTHTDRAREYLLPIDLRESTNVDGASTQILERVLFLLNTPDWSETHTAPISDNVRIIIQ